ncbi:MAG TPA: hypothetical protein DC057_10545 [Spirochaetia bacterium]|nr:hypothetical protein [Spirochaetia bacterium]
MYINFFSIKSNCSNLIVKAIFYFLTLVILIFPFNKSKFNKEIKEYFIDPNIAVLICDTKSVEIIGYNKDIDLQT